MEPSAAWSSQQLAEFLAVVSAFDTEDAAALGAVEHAAQALDAKVAAIVTDSTVVASVGYQKGTAPLADLKSVALGSSRGLMVPGVGLCPAIAVAVEYPPHATFVLARIEGLNFEEISMVQGMAHVVAITMRMLHLVGDERALRNEQAALRRVATLVARGVDQQAVLAAVAEEIGRLAGADLVSVFQYEADGTATRVASWAERPPGPRVGESIVVGEHNWVAAVQQTGKPARNDESVTTNQVGAKFISDFGVRASVATPIVVDGKFWGAALASSTGEPLAPGSEERIAGFAELVATAISNAKARAELAASRARIVAASDATRRRIERDLHDGIQQRLVTLALGLSGMVDSVPSRRPDLAMQLREMERGLQELIEEVRVISRGLHPAILSQAGLAPALKSLARRSAVPVELEVQLEGRFPPTIEVAAYYIVSEALNNTVKHAGASVAQVTVGKHIGWLRIQVSDDGAGGADFRRGSGLIGLIDRVASLGGTLAISSPQGAGTTLVAELPSS
jgi:signal transduction histidine kinase